MLAQRGVVLTYETIRAWCLKFGQTYANDLRRRSPRPGDRWHLDEVFLKIYRPDETVGPLEPAGWTQATGPFVSDARLDLLLVTGTGQGRQWLDELRLGRTWESVTRKE